MAWKLELYKGLQILTIDNYLWTRVAIRESIGRIDGCGVLG